MFESFLILSVSFFLWYWVLNSRSTPGATPPALFCDGFFFWDRVSQTICLGWLQNVILLISASWVAKITGVSHQHSAFPNSHFPLLLSWNILFPKFSCYCLSSSTVCRTPLSIFCNAGLVGMNWFSCAYLGRPLFSFGFGDNFVVGYNNLR
jgi:hypothetical protein